MAKKQILMCTVGPIFPIDAGGKLYISNTLDKLSRLYDYHLLTYVGGQADIDEINKYQKEYNKYFKSINYVFRPKMLHEKKRGEKAVHFFTHLWYKLPLMDISFFSKEYVKLAGKLIKEHNIELIEAHNLHTAFIKKFYPQIPMALINQNIEGDIFPFWPPQVTNKYKKKVWDYVIQKSRTYTNEIELNNMYKIEAKTFISLNDLQRANQTSNKCFYLPLGFKADKLERKLDSNVFKVVWVGGFGWYPNEQAMNWFLENIYPILEKRKKNLCDIKLEIHIVGGGVTEKIKSYHNNIDVFVHGRVDDLDTVFRTTNLLIAPILAGGGVKVKIVESMSKGIPVISTTKGAEGLSVEDGKNIIIRDNEEEFAEAIINLAAQPQRLEEISNNALAYIREHHNIEKCISTKQQVYNLLLTK